MSGAAKARNKARPRRAPGRIRSAADGASTPPTAAVPDRTGPTPAGAAAPSTASAAPAPEVRGTVPAPRTVPGQAAVAQVPARTAATQAEPGSRTGSAASAPAAGPGTEFARGYPAPADAVRCAMLGSPPTFWFDGDAGRLTIAVESGRLVASGVMHLDEDLAQLVAAVLLNHDGEPADAIEPVRAALQELAALAGYAETEVTADLSGSSPRLGWLSRFDPAPWVTWHDWWNTFVDSPAARTAAAVSATGAGAEVDACFRRQGLRVARCAEPGCVVPLTDRHPAWPGLWSAASGAHGPVCAVAAEQRAWPAGLLAARPHRVAEG